MKPLSQVIKEQNQRNNVEQKEQYEPHEIYLQNYKFKTYTGMFLCMLFVHFQKTFFFGFLKMRV